MRYVVATLLACLLAACSGLPQAPVSTCSSAYQCEIEAYAKAQ